MKLPHAGKGNPRDTRAVAMVPNNDIRNPGSVPHPGVLQSELLTAMANDAPPQSLALSDIMHTLSPSPGPQSTEYANGTDAEERARSPDPPQEVDLKSYRNKLSEMCLLSGENESATPRERELANMVCLFSVESRYILKCAFVGTQLTGYEAVGPNTTFRAGRDYFRADAGARTLTSAVFGGTGSVEG